VKITRPYSILFNAIVDVLPLIKQGLTEQAHDLLTKALQQTEEIFISSSDRLKVATDNLAEEVGVSREYICELIRQNIINQDGLDSPIYDFLILDEYENEPYFDLFCNILNKAQHTYFQFGFDAHAVLMSINTRKLSIRL